MPTELEVVAQQIEEARSYLDVFGGDCGDNDLQTAQIKQIFRRLAKAVHPDRLEEAEKDLASRAFTRLEQLHAEALIALEEGRYGQIPVVSIKTRRFEHRVGLLLAVGDVADLYAAESTGKGSAVKTVVKVVRHPQDNALLETEARTLRKLRETPEDARFHPFFPNLVEAIKLAADRQRRQACVIGRLEGFYTLEQVLNAHPNGIHPLDMVWMWRRLLFALGYVEEKNLIHGALVPSHIMIQPEQHGLVIVDWAYSTTQSDDGYGAIKAIVPRFRDWYPKEVLDNKRATIGLDVGMAARCMVQLIGGNPTQLTLPVSIPRPLRIFLTGTARTSPSRRSVDVFTLLKEFDELLEELGSPYHPRRFRAFTMPNGIGNR